MQLKTRGIVLSETPYSETSKILNVLTSEFGLIGIISKGCKKPKSPLHEGSKLLIYGIFDISYKEDGLSTLIEIDIKDNFKNSSMSHVLAISGMHVSYVIIGVQVVLDKFVSE